MGLRMSFFQESIDHTHKKDYVFIPRGIFYLLQSYWEESIKWDFVSKATDLTHVLSQGKNDTET